MGTSQLILHNISHTIWGQTTIHMFTGTKPLLQWTWTKDELIAEISRKFLKKIYEKMLLSLLTPSIRFALNKHFFFIIIDTGKSPGMENSCGKKSGGEKSGGDNSGGEKSGWEKSGGENSVCGELGGGGGGFESGGVWVGRVWVGRVWVGRVWVG